MSAVIRLLIRLTYYPTLVINRLMCGLGVWRLWDAVDDWVIVGAIPSRPQLSALKALGVTAIVNMCEESNGDVAELARLGIEQLRLPTVDYCHPSLADLTTGVNYLLARASRHQRTYVHCKAGRGRAPTLVLCYLIASQNLSVPQAFGLLKRAHRQVIRSIPRRAEVLAFARQLQKN